MPTIRAIIMLSGGGAAGFLLGEPLQAMTIGLCVSFLWFNKKVILDNYSFNILILFAFINIISIYFSDHPYTAVDGAAHYILLFALFFGLQPLFKELPQLQEGVLWSLLITGSVYLIIFTPFYMIKHMDSAYNWGTGMLGFRNIRHFGMYMAILAIVSCLPLLKDNLSKVSKIISLLFIALFVGFLFISGGRGGTIALLITLPLVIVLSPKKRFENIAILCFSILLALWFSNTFAINAEFGRNWQRALGLTINLDDTINQLSSGRFLLWSSALDYIKTSPIIGHGAGVIPTFGPFIETDHPHNSVLQILLDWGLLGFTFFAIILGNGIAHIRKLNHHIIMTPAMAISVILLVYLCLHSLISGALFMRINLIVAAIALAIFTANLPKPTTARKSPIPRIICGLAVLWVCFVTVIGVWVSVAPNKSLARLLLYVPLLEGKVGSMEWRLAILNETQQTITPKEYIWLGKHCSEKSCPKILSRHQASTPANTKN